MIYLTGPVNGRQDGFVRLIRYAQEHHLTGDDAFIVLGSFGSVNREVKHFTDYFNEALYHVYYVDEVSFENEHVHHLSAGVHQMAGLSIAVGAYDASYVLLPDDSFQGLTYRHLYFPGESKDVAKNVTSVGDIVIELGSDVTHVLNYLHYKDYITHQPDLQLAYRQMRHLEDDVNDPLLQKALNDLDQYMHELNHEQIYTGQDHTADLKEIMKMCRRLKMIDQKRGISQH